MCWGLHRFVWAFSSCQRGLLFLAVHRASYCRGFTYCGAWALDTWASVVVAHRLSCPMAYGIFLDQNQTPALGSGFLSTEPPGKSKNHFLIPMCTIFFHKSTQVSCNNMQFSTLYANYDCLFNSYKVKKIKQF